MSIFYRGYDAQARILYVEFTHRSGRARVYAYVDVDPTTARSVEMSTAFGLPDFFIDHVKDRFTATRM